ncbi:helix-turn-helix domain-containing protein [Fulvivirga ligni]|uniref:helix-turn-helix domain-containing protein n=1 Tax=Fulvivirga ligni TaxID=2904246 RepID=UPI001F295C35|nr:helix-turn-helix transcriptional regulator [Fulvivirga ligni]UII21667.1 helix-turn-helix domain-containing protein [Fulvivirga ligni]
MNKKSDFEMAVVSRVKDLRVARNLSQDDLAIFLDLSRGFIGQIESPRYPSKYNLNHLNTLAKHFGCSPKDFLPENPL